MSGSNAEKGSNVPSKSQDDSCSKMSQLESVNESGENVALDKVVQSDKPDDASMADEIESQKLSSKNKGSSSELDEKMLTACQMAIQKCSTSSKHKRDDAQDGKEEDLRQETKRKSRKCKQANKTNAPRGKGRRFIFKKNVAKTPVASSIPVIVESLMYEGQYWQVGDIVSVNDVDGGVYYCQVRGLLQDQYCEKSAALTWLLPTIHSPPQAECFDPSTYIIGQEEEIPRKMEYLTFVCHAPSDYYKLKNSPYPTSSNLTNAAHVWASMKPVDVRSKSQSSRS
ncbi:hypothetical protein FHG87_005472 [Trinorchestia longiramus]|nr:hypothetical protein FHG87_005472 [Trinorchestia longiramus]